MKIIPLSEGVFTIDKTKVFVPFDEEQHKLSDRPKGSLVVEIQPFLLITERDVLLLDTGLGFKNKKGVLQLYANLNHHGIHPAQVTKVLLSHLHKDHAGGVSYRDNLGHYHLSFPEAEYYLSAKELDFAYDTGFPSFMPDELSVLHNNKQVRLLKQSEGIIDEYIRYEHTGGHSPYHIAFHIKEDDSHVFFGGDEAPQHQQMRSKFVAKYDYDGKRAMQLRQQWWEQGCAEHWTFLFYHDIKLPFYQCK